MKTYVIISVAGNRATVSQVRCTFRELLEQQTWGPDRKVYDDDDAFNVRGRLVMTAEEMSDEELIEWFNSVNADGEPFVSVWCVEDERLVLE